MSSIIISVIIPTVGRPTLLQRAIGSCLTGKYAEVTEVIVVPNGPDSSWQVVRDYYHGDPRVRFVHSDIPDRDIARNIGIEIARGDLIRFLDDDDFLLPTAASKQYELLITQKTDFCSAAISVHDQEGNHLQDVFQPHTKSGLIAALSYDRLQIPLAHVYRRSSIQESRWPTGIRQSEDIVWLITYAAKQNRSWTRMDEPVGVWYQHDGTRMSLDRPSGFVLEPTAFSLIEASKVLMSQKRWNSQLATTTGRAIWECVHRAFPFRPLYWTGIALRARRLAPNSKPGAPIYRMPIHPLLVLWLLLPERWIVLAVKRIRARTIGWDYRRRL